MAERKERYIIEFKDIPGERKKMPELIVEERVKGFSEVELGYEQGQAIAEAARCLSCRQCIGCGLCLAVCYPKAIDYSQIDRDIDLEADSIIITPGVERIPSDIEERFGYGKYINVIIFQEFERILSNNGPYKGLILRPHDGEIPRRIAFLACNAHQGIHHLPYAIKAAFAAQRKVQDLETHLFFLDSGAHRDEFRRYLDKEPKINIRSGEVLGISENGNNKNLIVKFIVGEETEKEEFDLVVLLTTLKLLDDVQELARKLGVDSASHSFEEIVDTSLIRTSKKRLFFAGLAFTEEAEKIN
ncbi:hypothetical protein ACFLVS_05540 [Chloroflexota bacterium]